MKRGKAGTYDVTSVGGEQIRAFIPSPLPPVPPLSLDAHLQPALEAAVLAIGRLDGVATLLADKSLFLYTCPSRPCSRSAGPAASRFPRLRPPWTFL